jgi:hypothetical protein
LFADSHSILARWRKYFSQLLNVHWVDDVRKAEVHTAEPIVLETSAFEVEFAIEKLKRHKSTGTVQIPTELTKAGCRTIRVIIHKIIISTWKRRIRFEEWNASTIVPIYKKRDKTDCNNYRGISLLPTTYKTLSIILLFRLSPYAEEIIGDYQCGFRRNRSTADHIFCIRQILEITWE